MKQGASRSAAMTSDVILFIGTCALEVHATCQSRFYCCYQNICGWVNADVLNIEVILYRGDLIRKKLFSKHSRG
jgi:hypothetical protein